MIDTTIVIPAYKPDDLLERCVKSLHSTVDFERAKLIVVCNGSGKASADFLIGCGIKNLRMVWIPEGIGFTKAANIGLKMVDTPYILLVNTDVEIYPLWEKHKWVEEFIEPLRKDFRIAVTGLADMHFMDRTFLPFFCVGLRKDLLEQKGFLDEVFSPGYGEDMDFCYWAQDRGLQLKLIVQNISDDVKKIYTSGFPLFHKGQGSFGDSQQALANRGNQIIFERYFTPRK